MSENTQIAENIMKIKNTLESFVLPGWDELPSIYLYMDQVIELATQYFRCVSELSGEEKILTPPMINNYIKMKAMPAPEKKRYGKTHLAYLLMISSLKQSMSIASMKSIIPLLENEEDIQRLYTDFVSNLKASMKALGDSITPIFEKDAIPGQNQSNAIMQIAIASNFMKVFSSGIITSSPKETETEKEAAHIKEEEK